MVFLTFVELYNNTFYDLLANEVPGDYNGNGSGKEGSAGLKLHEHPVRGMHLTGSPTLRLPVASAEEALALINKGYGLRATAATNLNERSSRSHTVLTLEIVSREVVPTSADGTGSTSTDTGTTTTTHFGKINLVDLAGSERVKLSGAEGQTLEEAKQINKALSVLGDVLNSLSKKSGNARSPEGKKQGPSSTGVATTKAHIPYRNSKLTMMLKDSLGGNAKTMMIATIRLSASFYQQTLTSLQYAARARHIRCNPVQNVTDGDGDEQGASMQRTLQEVNKLKVQLEQRTKEFNELKEKLSQIEKSRAQVSGTGTPINGSPSKASNAMPGVLPSGHAATAESTSTTGPSPSSATMSVVQALNPNDPDYAAKYKAAVAAENTMVEEYRKQIDSLQVKSAGERKQLQEKMKFVIHNHEGTIAEREKEYLGLEMELQQEKTRVEALSRAKENAIFSRKQAEKQSKELHDENRRQRMEIQRLTLTLHSLQKELTVAKDTAASAAMSHADREQFVEALQKLTSSRGKHKQRADEASNKLHKAEKEAVKRKEDIERLTGRLLELTSRLSSKNEELESCSKDKSRLTEQERLIAKAVMRIRDLEENAVDAMTPKKGNHDRSASGFASEKGLNSPGSESVSSPNSATAAASAAAIVVASTEAAAADLLHLQTQLDNKVEEVGMLQSINTEQQSAFSALAKELKEARATIGSLDKNKSTSETQAAQLKDEFSVSLSDLQQKLHQETELLQQQIQINAVLSNELEMSASEVQAITESRESIVRRNEAEIEGLQVRASDWETRFQQAECTMLEETSLLASTNSALQETNARLQVQVDSLESNLMEVQQEREAFREQIEANKRSSDRNSGDEEDEEVGTEAGAETEVDEGEEGKGALSPKSAKNQQLQSAVDALKQSEQSIFATLEGKLRDLDDARTKLVKLKTYTSTDLRRKGKGKKGHGSPSARYASGDDDDEESDDLYAELDVMRAKELALKGNVRASEQKAENRYVQLLSAQQNIQALQVRLDSTKKLLEVERQLGRDQMNQMDAMREEHVEEIEKVAALVKSSVSIQQERRHQSFGLEHVGNSGSEFEYDNHGVATTPTPAHAYTAVTSIFSSLGFDGAVENVQGSPEGALGTVVEVEVDDTEIETENVGTEPSWFLG